MARDASVEGSEDDGSGRPASLLTAARLSAVALVLGGFVGAVETGRSPVAADSAFSVAFYLGIALAFASIYVGIFVTRDER